MLKKECRRGWRGPVLLTSACWVGALIALGVISFGFCQTYYRLYKLETTVVDFRGTYETENLALREARSSTTIVFIGDSRVKKWQPLLSVPGSMIVNRGIPGETAGRMMLRFEADTVEIGADIVIVQAGINDAVAASLNSDYSERIIESAKKAFRDIAAMAKEQGTTLIFTTIVAPAKPSILRRLVWDSSILEFVSDLNEQIILLDSLPYVKVIDSNDALGTDEDSYLDGKYVLDTLHINGEAYAELNRLISQILSQADAI